MHQLINGGSTWIIGNKITQLTFEQKAADRKGKLCECLRAGSYGLIVERLEFSFRGNQEENS